MAITKVITYDNIDLQTLEVVDSKLRVKVENVVPAAKADRFLKSVAPSVDGTSLTFTVPDEEGVDQTFDVPMGSFVEGFVKTETFTPVSEKVVELEGKVTTLEEEVNTLKDKVAALEGASVTAEQIAALVTEEVLKNAIIEAIKGEEIHDLGDVLKGYLLATA